MVFFVLSGYVISYAADTKEHTLERYFVSRSARIGSVTISAILPTALADYAGYHLYSDAYPLGYQAWSMPLRQAASCTFTLYLMHHPLLRLFTAVFRATEISVR